MAATIGVQRQLEALRAKLPDRHGYTGSGWSEHVEGSAGELAVAKLFNKFWGGATNVFRTKGDVGEIEVRTRSEHSYELILRPDDHDDKHYVLVTGRAPNFRVHGYVLGRIGKRPEFLQTHGNRPAAYFVPQACLCPL